MKRIINNKNASHHVGRHELLINHLTFMQTEIETLPKTNYKGSQRNFESVKQQITERYGSEIASEYRPLENCRTYNDWAKNSYVVNRGARSFKAVVIVEKKDKITGEVIKKYPKTICLFFRNQVHKVE